MRKFNKILAFAVALLMIAGLVLIPSSGVSAAGTLTVSQQYVEAMGTGINLGNSFDSFDRVNHLEIDDETAWGNPVVTQAYLNNLKAKGYKSIRIPFTAFTRMDADYQIDPTFLQNYENVVNYALNAGFYVMINLHHDSSEWLRYWDGNTSSDQYLRFVSLWTQLANRFKNYGNKVMFESANEVYFTTATSDAQQNQMVGTINQAFYNVVRSTGGNNATRMLVLPTSYTNHGLAYSEYLVSFIQALNDPNIIATVHYYSTSLYAFCSNIGVPMFDQVHNGWTARDAADEFYDCIYQTFVDNGIGVAIGEYGLFNMGTPGGLEDGEVVKFIEYFNYKANSSTGICTMIWECGEKINRSTGNYLNSTWGDIMTTSMTARSSYATGLDTVFVTLGTASNNIQIPLTLNGNTLQSIYNGGTKLVKGTHYTYSNGVVTLLGTYIAPLITGNYGVKADLKFVFSAGSNWHEYIIYTGDASYLSSVNTPIRQDDGYLARYDTDGTPTYPVFIIPATYNGRLIKRVQSLNSAGQPASGNTWASPYMQCGGEWIGAYGSNELGLTNWYYNSIPDGTYTLVVEFYDGTTLRYGFTRSNGNITGSQLP